MHFALCTSLYALHSMHFTLCTSLYALHSMHFTLCTSLYALHSMHFTLCASRCALHSVHLPLCTSLYALCSMRFTLCTSLYALHSMHFALCTSLYALHSMHFTLCTSLYALHSMHFTLCTSLYALQSVLLCQGAPHGRTLRDAFGKKTLAESSPYVASVCGVRGLRGVRTQRVVKPGGVKTWRQASRTDVASRDVASVRGVRGSGPGLLCAAMCFGRGECQIMGVLIKHLKTVLGTYRHDKRPQVQGARVAFQIQAAPWCRLSAGTSAERLLLTTL